MPAHLTLRFADRPAQRFTLEEGSAYLAGRSGECALRIDDDRVSRRHARFVHSGGRWSVADLGSKNGVRVEGRPAVGPIPLPGACWLSLGGLVCRFEPLSAEEARLRAERDRVRWQTSVELRGRIDPDAGLARLLGQLLDSVLRLTGAERSFVVLARPDEPSGELEVAATVGVAAEDLAGTEFAGSVGAVERALATGRPVVIADAQDDAVLGARPSVAEAGIRALVCVPLEISGRGAGAVYADSRRPGSVFTGLDVEILQALSSHAALALAAAGLSREADGLARDLPTAARPAGEEPTGTVRWDRLVAVHAS